MKSAFAFLSVLLAGSAAAAPPPLDFAHLTGRWTVTGVATGGGVQALSTNDPAYMKRIVVIGRDHLVWVSPSDSIGGATVTDRCDGPVLRPLTGKSGAKAVTFYAEALGKLHATTRTPYSVHCTKGGTWGPNAFGGASLYPAPHGALVMTWYDGGVLRLERVRGRR